MNYAFFCNLPVRSQSDPLYFSAQDTAATHSPLQVLSSLHDSPEQRKPIKQDF